MANSSVEQSDASYWHVTQEQAQQAKPEPGELSVLLMRHGSMQTRYYEPVGEDVQTSHDQDEIYFVADGYGTFVLGTEEHYVAPGDMMFVSAGREHRFIDFTVGFAVWVIFYGPDGGEAGR